MKTYGGTRSWKNETTKHEKSGKKEGKKHVNKKQRTKERREGCSTKKIQVGNYGLRKAERREDMPSMSSEVGEI